MAGKQTLSNKLLGRTIKPTEAVKNDVTLLERFWRVKPVVYEGSVHPPRYLATIEAAWLSDDNHVKVLVRGPLGDIAEMVLLEGIYEISISEGE